MHMFFPVFPRSKVLNAAASRPESLPSSRIGGCDWVGEGTCVSITFTAVTMFDGMILMTLKIPIHVKGLYIHVQNKFPA